MYLLQIMIEIHVVFALPEITWHSGPYGQYCDIFFLEFWVDEDLVSVDNSLVAVINNTIPNDGYLIPN